MVLPGEGYLLLRPAEWCEFYFADRIDLSVMQLLDSAVLICSWSAMDEVDSAISVLVIVVSHVLIIICILVRVLSGARVAIPIVVLAWITSAPIIVLPGSLGGGPLSPFVASGSCGRYGWHPCALGRVHP